VSCGGRVYRCFLIGQISVRTSVYVFFYRLYHINPDTALEHTNRKFISRFGYVEKKAKEQGREINDMTLGEMDELWNEAKSLGL